ncbi:hypothetical protein BGX23_005827 [Mortierella sp. AD031]|nr:hypothetical protein BGX23_005827 [Mortierella sp. AD031]KAG0208191.1 hypothetical protein BGX33_006393 [Mortierella sp. NVP41]
MSKVIKNIHSPCSRVLAIPELQDPIKDLLDTNDLRNCSLVCRVWKSEPGVYTGFLECCPWLKSFVLLHKMEVDYADLETPGASTFQRWLKKTIKLKNDGIPSDPQELIARRTSTLNQQPSDFDDIKQRTRTPSPQTPIPQVYQLRQLDSRQDILDLPTM